MISFLLLCTPVFALVALGWVAIAARLMPHSAIDVLGSFSFRFALPALVFQLIGREPLTNLFEPAFFVGYLASGCLLFAFTFVAFRKARQARASARATTATVSNFVLAQSYTDDADRISAGIVLSTLVSVVTVPLVGWLTSHP